MTFIVSALTAIGDTSQLLAYSGYFFEKQSRVLFDANLYLLLVVHVHMKLENNASEQRGRSLVDTKSGEKLVIFEAVFKSLPCFQCSWNLQGIFIDNWSPDCRIYRKKLSSAFLKNAKFLGMDQITSKNYNKSSWMQVNNILPTRDRSEQFPSFFVCSFQCNQTTMGWRRVSKAYQFLKMLANCVDSMVFHCFYDC